jgi:hypothetical protein
MILEDSIDNPMLSIVGNFYSVVLVKTRYIKVKVEDYSLIMFGPPKIS